MNRFAKHKADLLQTLESEGIEEFQYQARRDWTAAKPLFEYCGMGCLTMIHNSGRPSYTYEITRAIRNDTRIPDFVNDITPASLDAFEEWQNRMVAEGFKS